jgi:AcrR family transcriptional regulator
MVDAQPGARRRGRPPATDSADTRRAILDSARRMFAERGYGAVTNRDVAASAGITTGALYHYVESKLDLYLAVHRDMQQRVYGRFISAVDGADTFIGQLERVLEAAHDLNEEDHTLALFVGAVRTDMHRFPEVAERLSASVDQRDRFFLGIVDAGVETGEILPEDRDLVVEFIRIMLVGLTEGVSESPAQHRMAIDSIRALLRGELIRSPRTSRVGGTRGGSPSTPRARRSPGPA